MRFEFVYKQTAVRCKQDMPHRYQRSSAKNKWSNEQLKAALADASSKKLSAYAAAAKYGIPSSTLHDHLVGKSQKWYGGAPTTLSYTEEKEVVRACETLQQYGFPMTAEVVGKIFHEYLESTHQHQRIPAS